MSWLKKNDNSNNNDDDDDDDRQHALVVFDGEAGSRGAVKDLSSSDSADDKTRFIRGFFRRRMINFDLTTKRQPQRQNIPLRTSTTTTTTTASADHGEEEEEEDKDEGVHGVDDRR